MSAHLFKTKTGEKSLCSQYLQHWYSLFSLSMSFLLIWVAWPKATLLSGMGIIVGLLFLEKAYLEIQRCQNTVLHELVLMCSLLISFHTDTGTLQPVSSDSGEYLIGLLSVAVACIGCLAAKYIGSETMLQQNILPLIYKYSYRAKRAVNYTLQYQNRLSILMILHD